MARYKVKYGGGWPAIKYSWNMAKKAGGILKLYRALRRKNTCKTCAFGMSGMTNELGHKFEVCKKSMQAQAQDMQKGIPPSVFMKHSLDEMAQWPGRQLEDLGRITQPLYAGPDDTHYRVIGYEEAYQKIVEHWKKTTPDRTFFYTSGRSSMEAAWMAQLLARQWGTNNVNNCSYYCHQPSGVGLKLSLGGGTATVMMEDLDKSDLVVITGANPASNHPRMLTFLMHLRRRGGKVVIINPYRELGLERFKVPSDWRSLLFGTEIASIYLQPHCGGDMALFKAAAARLHQEGKTDLDYMKNHCDQWEEFTEDLKGADWKALRDQSGVSPEGFDQFCEALGQSKNAIFAWAMGVTHQLHGVDTVRSIANLALSLGMIGKPGAGMMPIRGHSNVQGVGSVGVVPRLKPKMVEALAEHLEVEVPDSEGKDTFACMEAAHAGEVDFAFLLGGNLYGSGPDLKRSEEAFSKIDFTVYINTTLNLGHFKGRGKHCLILPVRVRDEEIQSTSQESMFNYVRLSEGGTRPPAESLPSESEVIGRLGRELYGEEPITWTEFSDHHRVREFISKTVPTLEPLSKLDQGQEFTIPGRIKHEPNFNTDSGNARLSILEPPQVAPKEDHFNLMTFRSEGQFNTIIYEEEDLYRGVTHRNVVFLSREDMEKLGVSEGDRVIVESEIDKMEVEAVEGPIRSGNVAMYYPEANLIIPPKVDPRSKTPSFKRCPVTIEKK